MSKRFSLLVLFCCAIRGFAQMPNSDVWLFKLELNKQKQQVPVQALNVSNRDGYDNQPAFSSDKRSLYYVSVRDDKQADVYVYDLKNKSTKALCLSKESEYSPTPLETKGKLATVMVEKDSTQRVHVLNMLNGTNESLIDVDSVGYFTFLNADTMIYYKLTEPHSLRVYSQARQEDQWLCDHPIRTFKAINRHSFVYGIKDSAQVTFYTYDLLLRRAQPYTSYPSLSEDIFWHPPLGLLKSEDSRILRFEEAKHEWTVLYDLASFGIKKISRFCLDAEGHYLALVNNL